MIDVQVYSSTWCSRRNINLKLIYDRLKREYESEDVRFYWTDTGALNAAEASRKYHAIGVLPQVEIYKDREIRFCRAGGVASYDTYRRALEELML